MLGGRVTLPPALGPFFSLQMEWLDVDVTVASISPLHSISQAIVSATCIPTLNDLSLLCYYGSFFYVCR